MVLVILQYWSFYVIGCGIGLLRVLEAVSRNGIGRIAILVFLCYWMRYSSFEGIGGGIEKWYWSYLDTDSKLSPGPEVFPQG